MSNNKQVFNSFEEAFGKPKDDRPEEKKKSKKRGTKARKQAYLDNYSENKAKKKNTKKKKQYGSKKHSNRRPKTTSNSYPLMSDGIRGGKRVRDSKADKISLYCERYTNMSDKEVISELKKFVDRHDNDTLAILQQLSVDLLKERIVEGKSKIENISLIDLGLML